MDSKLHAYIRKLGGQFRNVYGSAGAAFGRAVGERGQTRVLSSSSQWRILAILSAATGLLVLLGWAVTSLSSAAPAKLPMEVTDSGEGFVPTPEQRQSLVIDTILSRQFPAVTSTEGGIASDDDLTTPVFSPFSGRVTRLLVKLGDKVQKGQPLMSVDASEMVQAEDDLITAVSSLHSTHAQLDLAQTNEKRQKQLLDIRGAALKDVQQSESDLATAEGNYRTAQITLAGARNKLRIFGVSDAEIARMESLGAAPKANPEALLRAPIDGTVILRQVGVGQFIQAAAANPVFSISNLSKVWLVANVREVDAPHIHLGDPVNVHVLALPGRVFRASISYVAPSVDPVTHRLLVRADVDNVDSLLKLQMFASFDIITGRDRPAPAIPTSAILYEGSTARVWVAGPKGGLGLRELRLGRTDGDQVEALAGVKAGDRVVVRGVIFIDRAASGETD